MRYNLTQRAKDGVKEVLPVALGGEVFNMRHYIGQAVIDIVVCLMHVFLCRFVLGVN